jgi:predicted permease
MARFVAMVRGRESSDADLRAEIQAHLELAIDENIRRGMQPAEARRRALLDAGGLAQAAESVREQRGLPWLESTAADLHFAIRHLRRTPVSTAAMVLVLSLGIGTTVVLFTIVNSLTRMPAPGIERDESVVRIRGTMLTEGITGVRTRLLSWPEVEEYAGRTELFSSVAAYAREIGVLSAADETSSAPPAVNVIYTTSNYFSILGVDPVLGREPPAEADVRVLATSPTVMIDYAMWQRRFGGARDVIGRTLRINDMPLEIVGVAAPRFTGTEGAGGMTVWVPLAAYPLLQKRTAAVFASYDSLFLSVAARLQPDVTPATATPVVAGIAQRALQPGRDRNTSRPAGADDAIAEIAGAEIGGADVVPMLASNDRVRASTDMLFTGVVAGGFALLVLLITCTNVSALMVGLAAARRREIGVRLSLGAPRRRIVRQLLTESVLLALIAAAMGLVLTMVGIRLIGATVEGGLLVVDWRVTIATCAIAVITGILFGLSPALHATRVSVGDVLRSSSKSVAAAQSRLQRALVVIQIAMTQPLLVGLGVVVVTILTDLDRQGRAGAPDRIAEIRLDTWSGRVSMAEQASLIDAAVERVAAVPGVVTAMPGQMGTITVPVAVHPDDRVPGITYANSMAATLTAAPESYFEAFEIPLVRGRDFTTSERVHSPGEGMDGGAYETVIIGSDLAEGLWPGADPLGRRLTKRTSAGSGSADLVVVGVVDEVAAGPAVGNDRVRLYVPYAPINDGVIARTFGPALPLLNDMRRVVAAEAPQLPITSAQTLEQRDAAARREVLRISSAVAGGGLLALLLSAIGLYAVVSLAVVQRTREIGIRTALGAQSGQVIRMFFRSGLVLSALGLILGLPLSIMATRVIAGMVNLPIASSPMIGVATGAVVLAVASAAVWIPAHRASSIDPNEALRTE